MDRGAKIDQINNKKEAPIHHVAERGNVELAKLLVSHGADVHVPIKYDSVTNLNSSYKALMDNRSEMLRYLLEQGVEVHGKFLEFAASEDRAQMMEILLEFPQNMLTPLTTEKLGWLLVETSDGILLQYCRYLRLEPRRIMRMLRLSAMC